MPSIFGTPFSLCCLGNCLPVFVRLPHYGFADKIVILKSEPLSLIRCCCSSFLFKKQDFKILEFLHLYIDSKDQVSAGRDFRDAALPSW